VAAGEKLDVFFSAKKAQDVRRAMVTSAHHLPANILGYFGGKEKNIQFSLSLLPPKHRTC
jgi:hypothetical protein